MDASLPPRPDAGVVRSPSHTSSRHRSHRHKRAGSCSARSHSSGRSKHHSEHGSHSSHRHRHHHRSSSADVHRRHSSPPAELQRQHGHNLSITVKDASAVAKREWLREALLLKLQFDLSKSFKMPRELRDELERQIDTLVKLNRIDDPDMNRACKSLLAVSRNAIMEQQRQRSATWKEGYSKENMPPVPPTTLKRDFKDHVQKKKTPKPRPATADVAGGTVNAQVARGFNLSRTFPHTRGPIHAGIVDKEVSTPRKEVKDLKVEMQMRSVSLGRKGTLNQLISEFEEYDKKRSGVITLESAADALQRLGMTYSKDELMSMLDRVGNVGGSNLINVSESIRKYPGVRGSVVSYKDFVSSIIPKDHDDGNIADVMINNNMARQSRPRTAPVFSQNIEVKPPPPSDGSRSPLHDEKRALAVRDFDRILESKVYEKLGGMQAAMKCFTFFDPKSTREVDFISFVRAISKIGIYCSQTHLRHVFETYGNKETKMLNYMDLLKAIRSEGEEMHPLQDPDKDYKFVLTQTFDSRTGQNVPTNSDRREMLAKAPSHKPVVMNNTEASRISRMSDAEVDQMLSEKLGDKHRRGPRAVHPVFASYLKNSHNGMISQRLFSELLKKVGTQYSFTERVDLARHYARRSGRGDDIDLRMVYQALIPNDYVGGFFSFANEQRQASKHEAQEEECNESEEVDEQNLAIFVSMLQDKCQGRGVSGSGVLRRALNKYDMEDRGSIPAADIARGLQDFGMNMKRSLLAACVRGFYRPLGGMVNINRFIKMILQPLSLDTAMDVPYFDKGRDEATVRSPIVSHMRDGGSTIPRKYNLTETFPWRSQKPGHNPEASKMKDRSQQSRLSDLGKALLEVMCSKFAGSDPFNFTKAIRHIAPNSRHYDVTEFARSLKDTGLGEYTVADIESELLKFTNNARTINTHEYLQSIRDLAPAFGKNPMIYNRVRDKRHGNAPQPNPVKDVVLYSEIRRVMKHRGKKGQTEFRRALEFRDVNMSGLVSEEQFVDCLREIGLMYTASVLTAALHRCAECEDGLVDYKKFIQNALSQDTPDYNPLTTTSYPDRETCHYRDNNHKMTKACSLNATGPHGMPQVSASQAKETIPGLTLTGISMGY